MRTLNGLTYHQDELIRWRAVEALGKVAGSRSLSAARDLVRRQFWTMTEESGGTAWRAPEVIGEILANHPDLIKEFGVILSSYFKEEPFERGAYWAVARTIALNPGVFQEISEDLFAALEEDDPFIRYQALSALKTLGLLGDADQNLVDRLKDDPRTITLYDFSAGDLKEARPAELLEDIKT